MASKKKSKRMAAKADKYKLYEASVQCVEAEIDFVHDTFKELRGRCAKRLREDFCGTTNTSCEWVRRDNDNIAYSIDLDAEVLDWAKQHKQAKLKDSQAQRLHIIHDNVLTADIPQVDVALAMNFSYWLFVDRDTMLRYFTSVHESLVNDGIFFLDAFGGYEAYQNIQEETAHEDFTYVWDQKKYNPITGEQYCRIHFKFKDGSKMKNAFQYHWRLWGLPEIVEMLSTVGFQAKVYWEGADDNGEGNGIFLPTTDGSADAGWIAYIVATR